MLILKPIEDSVAKIRRILRKYKLFRSSMPLVETYGHLMPLMATFHAKSSRCSSTTPPPLIWPVSPAAPSCRRKSPPSSPSSAHLEIGKKCLRVTRDGFGVSDGKPGVSGIPPKPPFEGGRGFLRTGL